MTQSSVAATLVSSYAATVTYKTYWPATYAASVASYASGSTYDCGDSCGGGGGCFPPGATAALRGGAAVRMDELRTGDEVLSYDERTGQLTYSRVFMWLERRPALPDVPYVRLHARRAPPHPPGPDGDSEPFDQGGAGEVGDHA